MGAPENLKRIVFKDNTNPILIENGKLFFTKQGEKGFSTTDQNSDGLVTKTKMLFKKHPLLFCIAYNLFGGAFFVGKSAGKAIADLDESKLIVNIGSGTKKIREDVVNLDFYPFNSVDIVADVYDLPMANDSLDCIINEHLLEHVARPSVVVEEMYRVLKPGGRIYIVVPFVAGFHSSPHDYYRWSKPGLRELLKNFKELDSGIRSGPTLALVYVASEWLATFLSLGFKTPHQLLFMAFMVIFTPLRFLDFVLYKIPSSENIAYEFYYVGEKIQNINNV